MKIVGTAEADFEKKQRRCTNLRDKMRRKEFLSCPEDKFSLEVMPRQQMCFMIFVTKSNVTLVEDEHVTE